MIYFVGDVHGKLGHVLSALRSAGVLPASVVFLGDIEPQRPFDEEIRPLLEAGVGVWFIHGNNDTDCRGSWDSLQGSWHRNLHGRVAEIDGVRVAGLGGVFRGEIWHPDQAASSQDQAHRAYADYERALRATSLLRRRLTRADSIRLEAIPSAEWEGALLDQSLQGRLLKHRSSIFPDEYDALAGQQADVLVTHEAPSCHLHGFEAIDLLAQAMGVKAVFHGHHHDSLDYRAWEARLGFKAFGVGFRGITDLRGSRLLAGDYDEARRYRETHPEESGK